MLRAGASQSDAVKRLTRGFKDDHAVLLGGDAVAAEQASQQATRDLGLAELITFPLLALLAWLIFRGIAALLPLAVGAVTVVTAFALLRAVNLALPLSPFALNLVIGLGLGLAVDYSLPFTSRFREELGYPGAGGGGALAATLGSAGRTVSFSAVTVAAAMACLTVFPQRFLISMGIGGAAVRSGRLPSPSCSFRRCCTCLPPGSARCAWPPRDPAAGTRLPVPSCAARAGPPPPRHC